MNQMDWFWLYNLFWILASVVEFQSEKNWSHQEILSTQKFSDQEVPNIFSFIHDLSQTIVEKIFHRPNVTIIILTSSRLLVSSYRPSRLLLLLTRDPPPNNPTIELICHLTTAPKSATIEDCDNSIRPSEQYFFTGVKIYKIVK